MKIALCLTGLLGGLEGRNGSGKTIDPELLREVRSFRMKTSA
jgi:hypothetical protein